MKQNSGRLTRSLDKEKNTILQLYDERKGGVGGDDADRAILKERMGRIEVMFLNYYYLEMQGIEQARSWDEMVRGL